jgi:hypothetical protein
MFGELACLGAFLTGVLTMLVTRRAEIEAPNVVLLTVSRVGVPIVRSYGKSRITTNIVMLMKIIIMLKALLAARSTPWVLALLAFAIMIGTLDEGFLVDD